MPELQLVGYRKPRVWLKATLMVLFGVPLATASVITIGYLMGALARVCGGGP